MSGFPSQLKARLSDARSLHQYRFLKNRSGIDFTSNDYLGFSQDSKLLEILKSQVSKIKDLGSSGSRLLRGQVEIFDELEKELAQFCGTEAALFFPSGYQANLALYSTVLKAGDVVFSDQFNHASIIDGIRLSKATCEIYEHNNVDALELKLSKYKNHSGLKIIATEALFSMEGDQAPLSAISKRAEENKALLIVDEAHSTGLGAKTLTSELGLQNHIFATVHTGGKVFGSGGAWISSSHELKEYLINFARPFIFSTAPQPFLALTLKNALKFWEEEGILRSQKVSQSSRFLLRKLREGSHRYNYVVPENTVGPIIPVILGESKRALDVALNLEKRGFDVRAIRPPTVVEKSSRLRITVNALHTDKILSQFIENLFNILERFPA